MAGDAARLLAVYSGILLVFLSPGLVTGFGFWLVGSNPVEGVCWGLAVAMGLVFAGPEAINIYRDTKEEMRRE